MTAADDTIITCPDVDADEGASLRLSVDGGVFIDAYNEGGCCGTTVNLKKLLRWMRVEHPAVFTKLIHESTSGTEGGSVPNVAPKVDL